MCREKILDYTTAQVFEYTLHHSTRPPRHEVSFCSYEPAFNRKYKRILLLDYKLPARYGTVSIRFGLLKNALGTKHTNYEFEVPLGRSNSERQALSAAQAFPLTKKSLGRVVLKLSYTTIFSSVDTANVM